MHEQENSILGLSEPEICWISWQFHTYEQSKCHAQLSWEWKKFYNLEARSHIRTANVYMIHEFGFMI